MPRKNQHKRVRRTKEQLALYGTNSRKLLPEYPVIKKRLNYLCDFLFGGNRQEMAAALGVCYRQLHNIMIDRARLTIAVAAQIVAKLGIRAEWLLCGTGDVFAKESDADTLVLPKTLRSSFQMFDALNNFAGTVELLPPPVEATRVVFDSQPFADAGRAVYQARVENRPVGFFLGSDSFRATPASNVLPFFTAQYATVLVTTLDYAQYDLYRVPRLQPDFNNLALTAATRGVGFGEVIGSTALPADAVRDSSVLVSVYDMGLQALVSAEIGELVAHAAGPVRGAEAAAAVGAAAYVDLLIFTEQVRNFVGNPGGVFVVAGEIYRGVRFFLQRLEAVKLTEPLHDGFTLALFTDTDIQLQTQITKQGGRVIFLGPPTTAAVLQLFQACSDAYAGKIK